MNAVAILSSLDWNREERLVLLAVWVYLSWEQGGITR